VRELPKVVLSLARLIAGLPPKSGRVYYVERLSVFRCIAEKLGIDEVRGSKRCPFCGREFSRTVSVAIHIYSMHYHDVEHLIKQCREELRKNARR